MMLTVNCAGRNFGPRTFLATTRGTTRSIKLFVQTCYGSSFMKQLGIPALGIGMELDDSAAPRPAPRPEGCAGV